MLKVQLYFTLVGRSASFERKLSSEMIAQFTNEYRLDVVRGIVAEQFGNRAIVIMNEDRLKAKVPVYPEFYSAGWFVSQGDDELELIIVEHGRTMESATRAMMESVKAVDWSERAAKVRK